MADINWEEEDKKYIWHPAMQMKDNEVFPPVVADHGKGVYLYDTHGKEYLDIISSWWCNLLGHCNPEINEALKKQVDQLEHVIFTNFIHKPAIELCRELEPLLPKGLTKFTFHDNGSSSVEAALKMAFQYQYQTGHPERTRFMCLPESYHGETIGALDAHATLDAGKVRLQQLDLGGVELEQAQVIAFAQHLRGQLRRAGVPLEVVTIVEQGDLLEQAAHGFRDGLVAAHGPQVGDAGGGFTALGGIAAGEVVEPATSVGVDHPEGFVFLQQVLKHLHQHHVLEHIGVVARVKSVAVTEHARMVHRRGPPVAVACQHAVGAP